MASEANIDGAHRELLADISDRYGWGARPDTTMGPETGSRQWNQAEAQALIEVVSLRREGLTFDQIDVLIEAGPEPLVTQLAARLEASANAFAALTSAA